MPGVSLSRWTMSYFAAALIALLAAELLMAVGFGYPDAELLDPETLILVHVVAIGWLSLLMCGALFQFLPVLINQPLASNSLPLPALIALVSGLAALILGFVQMAGRVDSPVHFFLCAALLLGLGFTLVLWNLGRTLWSARAQPLPARFVIVGLASIAATATLGIIFALVLGGSTTYGPFLELTGLGLPIHVIGGLGGWLTFTAIGVSYRLLAMFMLAPELGRTSTKAGLHLGTAALAMAIVGGTVAILLHGDLAPVLLVTLALGVAALLLYGGDVVHLYRARKRRKIELNSRMAEFAFVSLAASVLLLLALLALGHLSDNVGAVVVLLAFGWLTGLGLSQLYKIVAFLTWLECYGPVLGRAPTPRVQDLVVEGRAAKYFLLYSLAVWAGTVALITHEPLIFRFAAAAMLLATGGIALQLVRTRRLADVAPALRFPEGVQRPRLLLSLAHQP